MILSDLHAGRFTDRGAPAGIKLDHIEHIATQSGANRVIIAGDAVHKTGKLKHNQEKRNREATIINERLEHATGTRIRIPGNHDLDIDDPIKADEVVDEVYQNNHMTVLHGHTTFDESIAARIRETEQQGMSEPKLPRGKRMRSLVRAANDCYTSTRDAIVALSSSGTPPTDIYAQLATVRRKFYEKFDGVLEGMEESSPYASMTLENVWMRILWTVDGARKALERKGDKKKTKLLGDLLDESRFYLDLTNTTATARIGATLKEGCVVVSGHTHKPGMNIVPVWDRVSGGYTREMLVMNTGSMVHGTLPPTSGVVIEQKDRMIGMIVQPDNDGIPRVAAVSNVQKPICNSPERSNAR